MNITYCRKSDMAYLYIDAKQPVGYTNIAYIDGHIVGLDFTAGGKLVGIEFFDASKILSKRLLK